MEMVTRESPSTADNEVKVQVRLPKRILHFSDGIIEEFSDDEDQVDSSNSKATIEHVDEVI